MTAVFNVLLVMQKSYKNDTNLFGLIRPQETFESANVDNCTAEIYVL